MELQVTEAKKLQNSGGENGFSLISLDKLRPKIQNMLTKTGLNGLKHSV